MGRHLRASSFKSLYCEMLLSITVPYHSASNEAAENAVRTFKKKFKVLFKDNMKHDALCKYLFYYRSTPHCTTEKTPAELHLNRRLRTRLDIRCSKKKSIIFPIHGFSNLYLALYKCDRVTPNGVRKIRFRTKKNFSDSFVIA